MRLRLSERSWLALVGCVAVLLFVVANRGAYEGFFSDDDLDNLGWTTIVGWETFRHGWLTPLFSPDNFRPTGHVFYRLMHSVAALEFPRWVAVLQVIHLGNTVLVFALCRALGAWAAWAGAAFFLFHPALFAAFWKPMYIFDVLCATFLLISLLLYLRDRWVWSLVAFWMAYKSKEVALFYPCALALMEWSGARRWWRLIPFFGVSLSFGLQAALVNRARDTPYTLRFTLAAMVTCAAFYAKLLLPGVAASGWFGRRDRRVWAALLVLVVLVGPLWFLPGRLFSVYLYVPMVALAVAVAFAFERLTPAWAGAVLVAWFGFTYLGPLREFRKAELTIARESRTFFQRACPAVSALRGAAFYEGAPPSLAAHGVEGVFHLCASPALKLIPLDPRQSGWRALAPSGSPLLSWDSLVKELRVVRDEDASRMNAFRLDEGWYPLAGGLRWSREQAGARVTQPPEADEFFVDVRPVLAPGQTAKLTVMLDGVRVGEAQIDGRAERQWPVAKFAAPAQRRVEFLIAPAAQKGFGLPFADFGFRPRGSRR